MTEAQMKRTGMKTSRVAAPPEVAAARDALVAAMARETTTTELPRLVGVLDALIAWSAARPELTFRADTAPAVSYERTKSKVVLWSARVTRGAAAKLEIYPPT